MSDRQYGPFERPINITDFEWRLLEELREGRTVSIAAAELNMPAHRLRFLLANGLCAREAAGQRLRPSGSEPEGHVRARLASGLV